MSDEESKVELEDRSSLGESDMDAAVAAVNPVFSLVKAPVLKSTSLSDRMSHLQAYDLYVKQVESQFAAGARVKMTSFKESMLLKDLKTICEFELEDEEGDPLNTDDVTSERLYEYFQSLKKLEDSQLSSVNISKVLDGLKFDTKEDIATRVSTFFGEVRWRLEENRCLELVDHKSSMKALVKEIIKKLEPTRLRNAVQKTYDFQDPKPDSLTKFMKLVQRDAKVLEDAHRLGLGRDNEVVSRDKVVVSSKFKKPFRKPYYGMVSTTEKKPDDGTPTKVYKPMNHGDRSPSVKVDKAKCFRCGVFGHISTNCKAPEAEVQAYQNNRRYTRGMAKQANHSSNVNDAEGAFTMKGMIEDSIEIDVRPDTGSNRTFAGMWVLKELQKQNKSITIEQLKPVEYVLLADEKTKRSVTSYAVVSIGIQTSRGLLKLKDVKVYFMEGASKTLLLGTNDLKQLGIDIDSLLAKLAEESQDSEGSPTRRE